MEQVLAEIRDFADKAHGEQVRKYTPERYIVHPERVMALCRKHTHDLAILGAALLHDVLEDTKTSPEEMRAFLEERLSSEQAIRTMNLVIELTDVYTKKDYPELNREERKAMETERLASISDDAQTIKYADIIDNAWEIVEHDRGFAKVFLGEYEEILKRLQSGNPVLYQQAKDTVENGMQQLNA
jgi:(p)ppGpp synthase/HD superfamily hydrolase